MQIYLEFQKMPLPLRKLLQKKLVMGENNTVVGTPAHYKKIYGELGDVIAAYIEKVALYHGENPVFGRRVIFRKEKQLPDGWPKTQIIGALIRCGYVTQKQAERFASMGIEVPESAIYGGRKYKGNPPTLAQTSVGLRIEKALKEIGQTIEDYNRPPFWPTRNILTAWAERDYIPTERAKKLGI